MKIVSIACHLSETFSLLSLLCTVEHKDPTVPTVTYCMYLCPEFALGSMNPFRYSGAAVWRKNIKAEQIGCI